MLLQYHIVLHGGNTLGVVIYYKFHQNPFRHFKAIQGRKLTIPITLAIGFYRTYFTTIQAMMQIQYQQKL